MSAVIQGDFKQNTISWCAISEHVVHQTVIIISFFLDGKLHRRDVCLPPAVTSNWSIAGTFVFAKSEKD